MPRVSLGHGLRHAALSWTYAAEDPAHRPRLVGPCHPRGSGSRIPLPMECHTQDVIPKSFTNIADLSNKITDFNERKICSGARLDHLAISDLKEVKNGICKHGT